MKRTHPFLKLVVLVLIVGGAAVIVRATPLSEFLDRQAMLETLDALRSSVWAPVVYVLVYAAATALALPGSILTIVGGAVFGFGWGVVLVTIAANLGANAAFALSRWLGREGIERMLGPRLQGLDRATEHHGFVGLLILRLIPLVPFNALNFGSGLTKMHWRDYALATAIGILPGTLVYVFSADALMQGATGASGEARTRLLVAAGLFLALTLVPLIAKKMGLVRRRVPAGDSVGQPHVGDANDAAHQGTLPRED
ncbi:MAG: TVP38/TMEM64 family protein [Gemmatimonadales bacterium]